MKDDHSPASWIVSLLALTFLAVLSGYGVFLAFKIGGVASITAHGWAALGLAVVFTAGLTGGLLGLAFYSSRHGYDDQ